MSDADAVVVGAGPNGLVAANLLADAGWRVVVLESDAEPGGGVRSSELVAPGFVTDWASSYYPLAAASPVLRALDLEAHGLQWARAPIALAHPAPDGCAFVVHGDVDASAASIDGFAAGDGDTWRRLSRRWERMGGPLLSALLGPFPPIRAGAGVMRAAGLRLPWLVRHSLRSLRSAARDFRGEGGRLMLGGNVMHTDLTPRSATGALYGWVLQSLAQHVGFPVPIGGAGRLTDALVARLRAAGGELHCNATVTWIVVERGRAVGVQTASGDTVTAARAVIADTSAHALYGSLLDAEHVPWRVRRGLRRFRWDHATVKVDWALDRPVPWEAEPARRAGTVHLVDSMADLEAYATQLEAGLVPDRPFLVIGQTTTADPSRSPRGTEALWAYTHVPQQTRWDDAEAQRAADRIEAEIERRAPGFRSAIRARNVLTPSAFEARDPNLVGGAVNGGTARLRQQLVLRPVPGLRGGVRTPVRRLYLGSAAAHPGGGVHGAPGANAARQALRGH